MGLLRATKAVIFRPALNYAPVCVRVIVEFELCARRNLSTDDSRRLQLIKVLKDGDHEQRYSVHSSKVQSLTEEVLLERFRNLERLKIGNYDSLDALPLLAKHPFTIRNRVELLLESGFRGEMITVTSLARYLSLVKQTIKDLKKKNFIPTQIDVMSNILQHVDLEPQFYPAEMLDSDATILTIRKEIVRAFLKRRFGVTDQELKNRGQNITRLWNKSFCTINKNIRLIEDGVCIPTQMLRNHLYLLALNPANTETILKEVKMVGNLDIHTALKIRPKIICNSCGNLNRILKLFEEYKMPLVFTRGSLKLLTLSSATVEERLKALDEIEYFSLNKAHPRILALLCEQNVAIKRLKILEDNKLPLVSLNTLITTKQFFERYLSEGHYYSSRDLLYYISHQYGISAQEVKKILDKHPFWTTVSLITVGRNHKFLSGYLPPSEIAKSLYVLFYPCELVREEFFKLETREHLDCCRGDNGRIKPEYITPLITYFLEKEANFSYQGIWLGRDDTNFEASDAPHIINVTEEDLS